MHFIIDPYRFGETDPYFAYVTVLIHFDGTPGTQEFIDEAGHTITVLGGGAGSPVEYGAYISVAESKFSERSGRFQYSGLGSHGGLRIGSTGNPFAFGTGEFCIEYWSWTATATGEKCPIDFRTGATGATQGPLFFPNSTGTMRIYTGSTLRLTAGTIVANVWQNWVLDAYIDPGSPTQRVITLYLDGVAQGSWVDSVNIQSASVMNLARSFNNVRFWTGYIDELRITKGLSRYQGANFTPQTAPWPNS